MKLKYNYREDFEPLYPDHDEWPVVKMSKNRDDFIQAVTDASVEHILKLKSDPAALIEELETTRHREKQRLASNPWDVDPDDEEAFWNEIKTELLDITVQSDTNGREKELLQRIVHRYSNEIAGNFKHSYYRFTRSVVTFGFARLLNASQTKYFSGLFRGSRTLRDKIRIRGHVESLRKLAKKGTIVMVPTHFSNLDSILIGWVIHELGLPPFIYGAGLNLFNMRVFAYFMNSVGAYKVDRRKKNLIYLETLKTYSTLAIQTGCHSLFFPGGTRSRSGMIEKRLKLGLLGTAIEAQRRMFAEDPEKKVFIVPVDLNYNFVLEAPSLIRQYLKQQGRERYYIDSENYTTSSKIVKFLIKFFTKQAEISVTIGHTMDLFGNYVNDDGQSIGKLGQEINTIEYFMKNNEIVSDKQRDEEYTRLLSQRIIEEYHKFNEVLPSILVAFVAFQLLKKKNPDLDLYALLRLPEDELELPYEEFSNTMKRVIEVLHKMEEEDKLLLAPGFENSTDDIIKLGLNNLGMYHARRPIITNGNNNLHTKDMNLLYFYHNRLVGYDLEQYI